MREMLRTWASSSTVPIGKFCLNSFNSKYTFWGEPLPKLLILKLCFCQGSGFIKLWDYLVCNTQHRSILMLSCKISCLTSNYGKSVANNFIKFRFTVGKLLPNFFSFRIYFLTWTSAQTYNFGIQLMSRHWVHFSVILPSVQHLAQKYRDAFK